MPYDAKLFNNVYNYIKPIKKKILENGIKNMTFRRNEIMLDVGCGPGQLIADVYLPCLKPYLKHIVAVDIDKSMLKLAEEKYSHPQIYYKQLDFSIPITEEKKDLLSKEPLKGFDKIFSFFCLMKIRNQRVVAENIHKLLKPGGEALLVLNGKCDESEITLGLSNMSKWSHYIQVFDPKQYYNLIKYRRI